MKNYIIYEPNGKIVQISKSEFEPNTDLQYLEVDNLPNDIRNIKVVDGQIVEGQIEYELGYSYNRYLEYPQIREQLGWLWHDIDQGLFGTAAKQGQFYQAIQAVKLQIPKT
jgi:hypothetical protein